MNPAISISGKTRLVTLIGYPISHSLSPLIHNTAFQAAGLDFVYVAMPVAPSQLANAVRGLAALGAVGSNVTIPHKQRVHDLLDNTSDAARLVGAVNTLVFDYSDEGCQITGDNTDIEGFVSSLDLYRPNLLNTTAVVFGSGGAARAVSYGILKHFKPESLTLVVRDIEKGLVAANVLEHVAGSTDLSVVTFDDASDYVRQSRLIVNATPAGMEPHVDLAPWSNPNDFHSGQLVYDLICAPLETRLMREAAKQGAEVMNGIDMLVRQAAASYTQWTNTEMPVAVVRETLERYFAGRS